MTQLSRLQGLLLRALAVSLAVLFGCASGADTLPTATGGMTPPSSTIPPGPYTPGQSYLGRNGYIEYVAGNAPVILTAPHGGALIPGEIPTRTASRCGGAAETVTDLNTVELVRAMQQRYFARFGKYPHVVIVHLTRAKLDANRPRLEATCGDVEAETAFSEWHDFIDAAKRTVVQQSGKGWYMDMHGHGHGVQRLELGYLLTGAQLDLSDATLDVARAYQDTASVRTISEADPISFSALLRGGSSLGTLYANGGFPAVPSSADPRPNGGPYFSGGEDTRRHACGVEASPSAGVAIEQICGVQIETNFTGVRDNAANRARFGDVTALVLEQYLFVHWGLQLGATAPLPLTTTP